MEVLSKKINTINLLKILILIFFLNTIFVIIILLKVITINYNYANNSYDLQEIHKEALKTKEKDYIYNNNHYNVKYISNYDGDTAKFEILIYEKGSQEIIIKENVRFKNINAEEIRNKDEKKKAIAIKQKEELKNKLENAKQINLLNCEKEKYGRLLCELEVAN